VLSEIYAGEAIKKSSVFEWHKQFREGSDNVEDDEISCCTRPHRTEKMLKN
jgi:hypothetical protein